MSQVQIQKMSPRHDMIMEWLMANPHLSQGDCAKHFGMTQSWMSVIINSDAFQEKYKELLGDYHDERIIPLRDKLNGLAHRAVERLQVDLEISVDPAFHLDVADKMLNRLGYGKVSSGVNLTLNSNTTNNTAILTSASKEDLARARERMRAVQEQVLANSITHLPDEEPAKLLPASDGVGGEPDLSLLSLFAHSVMREEDGV